MEPSSSSHVISTQPSRQEDCASPILLTITLVWVVVITILRALVFFSFSAFPAQNATLPAIGLGIGQAVLLGVPLGLLAIFWRNNRYKAVFLTWFLMVIFTLALLPLQLTDPSAAQLQAVLHILLSLFFSLLVWLFTKRRVGQKNPPDSGAGIPMNETQNRAGSEQSPGISPWWVILIAAFVALPWLAWGALGSILDTILEIGSALSFGLAGGLILDRFLFVPLLESPDSSRRNFVLGATGAGIALLIMGSGTGFGIGGMQLLLMLVWVAAGGVIMAIGTLTPQGKRRSSLTWLAGLAAAAPMAFIDPDELALITSLGKGEILQWAITAAAVTAGIELVAGVALFWLVAVRKKPASQEISEQNLSSRGTPLLQGAALLAWVAAALVYFIAGQPGFYGEHAFVILKDQVDVSSASSISDYTQRRAFVYHTLVDHANSTQADLRNTLSRFHLDYNPYYLVNGLDTGDNPLLRFWLASRPEVDRVLNSPRLRPLPQKPPTSTGNASPPSSPQWNLTMIGADKVWKEFGVTGKGIVIGQSDSGVQADHPELASSYRGKSGQNDYNWYDPWYGTTAPTDTGGHGTHTLGSILGQHTGVAPGATWFACANLVRNLGDPPLYLDCMQFMLAPFPLGGNPFTDGDPSKSANVLNDSWGCPGMEGCDPNALLPAVKALNAAGIFVEASAGNDGPACASITDPLSLYAQVYVTGAIDRFGQLASFSSRGPVEVDGSGRIKPDIVAPGVDVLSAFPGNTYAVLSGTSMAGPHVVGVVALMWSANSTLIGDIEQTERILDQSAQPYRGSLPTCPESNAVPSTAVGYGIVDAYAAVQQALQLGK